MPSCNTYHLTWVSLTLDVGVSLHGCSSKAQWLLLTLDERYCLTAALPDLQSGIAPLGPPEPVQPPLLGLLLPATVPGLQQGVAPPCCCPWPQMRGNSQPHLVHWPLPSLVLGASAAAAPCAWCTGRRCLHSPKECRRAERSHPTLKVRKGSGRRYPSSKVRSNGCASLEQP